MDSAGGRSEIMLCDYWSPRDSARVSLRKGSFVDNEIRFKKAGGLCR